MKYLPYLFVFVSFSMVSQEAIETVLIGKTELKVDKLISINSFDSTFYILDNVLFKKSKNSKIDMGYSNFQLGNITSVDAFNPLKINVFYKDFNTLIILDNRLSEIFKIDFNTTTPYKNVSHVATGYDNTIWAFNQDTQQLELFDYKTKTTKAKTLPVKSEVLGLKSNYNYCWLLTKKYLYVFNYFGTLTEKIKNNGYDALAETNEKLILKKDNTLFFLDSATKPTIPIQLPNLTPDTFFATNETLYIYSHKIVYQYHLKTN